MYPGDSENRYSGIGNRFSFRLTVISLMKLTKAPPSSSYFEAMRRLEPEPPDEEAVEQIVEIYRAW